MYFAEQPERPKFLIRDNDGKFSPEFDQILRVDDVAVTRLTPLSPNLNAVAERWVQSVKQELLDHFVVFGETHLRLLLREYEAYFNELRPHQSQGNAPPAGDSFPPIAPLPVEDVRHREHEWGRFVLRSLASSPRGMPNRGLGASAKIPASDLTRVCS